MSYAAVVDSVAAHLDTIVTGRPLRVAIDGRKACGKSTFARAITARLTDLGRDVIHTTIDGFHNPMAVRYARGRLSAAGYYRDARDLAAIRRELLDPLGAAGDRNIRTETFDLAADVPVARPAVRVPDGCVVIVDGTFLARPEFFGAWDAHVFLRTSRDVARTRGINRDIASGVPEAQAAALFDLRYVPAFDLYEAEAQPEARADIVIDLDDFDSPTIVRLKV